MISEFVRTDSFLTSIPINQNSAGWYAETAIENHTGEFIYVMRPNGDITEIAPLSNNKTYNQRVIIKYVNRAGLISPDLGVMTGRITYTSPKFPQTEFTIDYKGLLKEPIFIPEVGLTIASVYNKHRLTENNYLNPDYFNSKLETTISQFIASGLATPVVVTANCHNPDIEFLYIEINGKLTSIQLRHDTSQNECLVIMINRNLTHTRVSVEIDWKKADLLDINVSNRKWILGTDLEKVQKAITDRLTSEKNKFSPEEISSIVNDKTEELLAKIEDLTKSNELLKRELDLTKKDLANSNAELTRANDSSKLSTEQLMTAYKLSNQLQDLELQKEKRELFREQSRIANEQSRIKNESDREIAEAKVRKEYLSVQSSEMTNYGNMAKTATILVPIVASAFMWFKSASAASSSLMVGIGLAELAPVVAIGLGIGVAVKCSRSLINHTKNIISKGVKTAKKFWQWLTD